jgi:PIN domain nuclease of toxin-antitoxin system
VKLLLDTHIWIWSALDRKRLSGRVTRALDSAKNELWLSPISVWELLRLTEEGRVELDRPVERWIAEACAAGPLLDATLTREVAIESRNLPLLHQDPADRFIMATARVYDLTLVTADQRLQGVPGVAVIPNR